jgi:hypothetical protein
VQRRHRDHRLMLESPLVTNLSKDLLFRGQPFATNRIEGESAEQPRRSTG